MTFESRTYGSHLRFACPCDTLVFLRTHRPELDLTSAMLTRPKDLTIVASIRYTHERLRAGIRNGYDSFKPLD